MKTLEKIYEATLMIVAVLVVLLACFNLQDARAERLPVNVVNDCVMKGRVAIVLALGSRNGLSVDNINVGHPSVNTDNLNEWNALVEDARKHYKQAREEMPDADPGEIGKRVAEICAYFYGKDRI